jgi:hypothetical protein
MVNLTYNKNRPLSSAEELPSSDETPVDNQLQNDIPNLLLQQLALIWSSRKADNFIIWYKRQCFPNFLGCALDYCCLCSHDFLSF